MKPEIKVGLTVLAAAIVLYVLLANLGGGNFGGKDGKIYRIAFSQVDGLMEGDPVDVRGIPYGKVERIEMQPKAVHVTISVDPQIELRADAHAEIQIKEILGGKQIALNPGQSDRFLLENQLIPGVTSLDFSTAFAAFGNVVNQLGTDRLTLTLARIDTLTRVLTEVAGAIPPAKVEQLVFDLESAGADLERFMADAQTRDLVADADTALQQAARLARRSDEAFVELDTLLEIARRQLLPKADSALTEILNTLDDSEVALGETQKFLQQLNDPNTVVGKMLNDPKMVLLIDSTLHNLNQTLTHVRTQKIHVAMSLSHKPKIYPAIPLNQDSVQKK